ncbi:MAG: TIGR03986 family CRISPR-associated RAMP protein [Nitrospirota bacterium]
MPNHRRPKRQGEKDHPSQPDNHFVYPYNFVPDGGKRRPEDSNGIGTEKGFKKLHRFDGLCGRIEYTIETLSPVFIPDSEGTTLYKTGDGESDIHRVMDFFNVKDRLCIPPTSIKGPVRSVLEAATNSSFGVINAAEIKHSYRKMTGFNNLCGVYNNRTITPHTMVKLPYAFFVNAARSLLGLPSTAPDPTFDELKNSRFSTTLIDVQCWKIHTGMEVVVEFTMAGASFSLLTGRVSTPMRGTFRQRPRSPRAKRMIVSGRVNYNCPTEQDVRIGPSPVNDNVTFTYAPFGGGLGDRVVSIQRTHNGRTYNWNGMQTTWYRNCRLWFHLGKSGRYIYVIHTPTAAIYVNNTRVLNNYETVNRKPLENDQVVFYRKDDSGNISEIGPVPVFKSAENSSLNEIVDRCSSYIKYPSSAECLCPATRLFGWTPEEKGQGQGIAGRVRFSPAWSDKKLNDTIQIPLKILGGPKPQYYPFYLKPKNGSDPNNKAAYYAETSSNWARTPGTIRGRKFFLHHPKALENDAIEYVKLTEGDLHTNQNATCAALPKGVFRGTIEFDSLEPYELGMLLWSLTLSDDPYQSSQAHAHKIGMGKGIGMGSVRFKIDNVYIENPLKNWFSLEDDKIDIELKSGDRCDSEKLKEYVRRFKTWMVTGSDEDNQAEAANYDNLPFVKDFLLVMSLNLVNTSDKIQYHSPAYPADEGFKYFMEQRRKRYYRDSGALHTNEEEPLYTPSAIKGI